MPIILSLIPSESSAQNIPFGRLTTENGLSNSYVNCLMQDRTGYIWFGTDDGLNRFDGYEIKVYRNNPDDKFSISENIIWALWEDSSGNLWIGTKSGGLNKYNPYNDKFDHWDLDSASTEEINITYIYEDSRKNIWIGTYRNGLYRFNPEQNKFEHWQNTLSNPKLLSGDFITSIIEDQNSNIWIATYAGLDKFTPSQSDKPFTKVIKDFNIPIWYLAKSSFFENIIWIGSLNGLFKFDSMREEISQINLPGKDVLQFGNSVSSVAEEYYLDEKILWVGTFGGLVQMNLSTGFEKRFLQTKKGDSEIVSNQIHDVIVDRSGVVWIATENGLNFYSQKRSKFNLVSSAIPLSEILQRLSGKNVRAVTQTKDKSLWFGTDAGLFSLKNETENSIITQNSELRSLNIWSLFSGSSNRLWIGTYGQGLKELNLETNQLKSWKVDNPDFNVSAFDYVKTILEDDDGMIWIGFWGGGLAKLNPITSSVYHWRNDKNDSLALSHNDIWTLHKDFRGRIWVGTNGGGLNLYNSEKQNGFYCWNSSNKNEQTLSSNSIFTICESTTESKPDNQTVLWIGTANGLNKFVIKNDSGSSDGSKLNVEIKYYTVEDGLPDNAIESILEDEAGNLWIGTSTGISFFNVKDEHFTNYTTADGLSGSSFNSSAAFKTSEGKMLFGCTNGLNYFDPLRIEQSTYSPPVIITDFQILNQPVGNKNNSEFGAGMFNSKEVSLSYNQNDFSFQFTSLDYNAPEMNQYAYHMEGFDQDWIYSGKRRFVTYTNLDPGEYVFEVKATNSDGMWSNQTAKIFIIINPPFWATWWAYIIYAMAFIGGLAFIRATELSRRRKKEEERLRREREDARLREAELKAKNIEQEKEIEKQKIRNRIAQDLHDEIGSNLSSISLMSELIQKDENTNPETSEKLKRIHKVAKGSTQSIRDIVWLTNPSSDSLKDLISKMKEVADNTLGKFNLSFDYPKDLPDINLLPETKRNIFFIYKEALNNIVKHAEAKRVEIRFEIEPQTIFLSIRDDGKGFSTTGSFGGNGLKNIRSRAKEINADLKFESRPGSGTILELSANITQTRD
ncbi:MAG: two-component regulator propeller domain-containing protein [Ignavibacteriaceae bacterium]|nr:two-component regulator propeller domain-containing protein [Ignavibacteriaceae bacterium]